MKYYILLALFLLSGIIHAQNTYKLGKTEYFSNQYYKSGHPKVKRNQASKKEFLKSKGYNKTPKGYEVDHIVPLSQGGTDSPSNMQLLTKEQHRQKTKAERRYYSKTNRTTKSNRTTTHNYSSSRSPIISGNKTIYTGSQDGKYYYNSKGKKTYIKNK